MIKNFEDIKELKYKYNLSYNIIYDVVSNHKTNEDIIKCLDNMCKNFTTNNLSEHEKKTNQIIENIGSFFDYRIVDDLLDKFPACVHDDLNKEDFLICGLVQSDDLYWIGINHKFDKIAFFPCYMRLYFTNCKLDLLEEEIDHINKKIINSIGTEEKLIYNCITGKIS